MALTRGGDEAYPAHICEPVLKELKRTYEQSKNLLFSIDVMSLTPMRITPGW